MLIDFTLRNWMCYRDKTMFSMVASDEELHRDRLSRQRGFELRVLPIAAIFGGNAAGKTCFIEAFRFAQDFVVGGALPDEGIDVSPFRLDENSAQSPSSFDFTVLLNGTMFRFGFEVTSRKVMSETLVKVTKDGETLIYSRSRNGKIRTGPSLPKRLSEGLDLVGRITIENELILRNTVRFNLSDLRPLCNWFRDSVQLIGPDRMLVPRRWFLPVDASLPARVSRTIARLDTGILEIRFEEVAESDPGWPGIPARFLESRLESADDCVLFRGREAAADGVYHAVRVSGKVTCYRWVSHHRRSDGEGIRFSLYEESAGARRLIEMLPVLFPLYSPGSKKVYLIDEFDRSLHTHLTRELLEWFLIECGPANRNQIILTTQDSALMESRFLRRDETWLAERGADQASQLMSLHDFKRDTDDEPARTKYLDGRYGGVPQFELNGSEFHGDVDSDA